LILFVRRFASHELRWRRALLFGALGALFYFANVLNNWPTAIGNYSSLMGWEAFVGFLVIGGLVGGLAQGLLIAVFGAAGDTASRGLLAKYPNAARGLAWSATPV